MGAQRHLNHAAEQWFWPDLDDDGLVVNQALFFGCLQRFDNVDRLTAMFGQVRRADHAVLINDAAQERRQYGCPRFLKRHTPSQGLKVLQDRLHLCRVECKRELEQRGLGPLGGESSLRFGDVLNRPAQHSVVRAVDASHLTVSARQQTQQVRSRSPGRQHGVGPALAALLQQLGPLTHEVDGVRRGQDAGDVQRGILSQAVSHDSARSEAEGLQQTSECHL